MSRLNISVYITIIVCLLLTACSSYEISQPTASVATIPEQVSKPTNTPYPPKEYPIKLAWFYKAPSDGNFGFVASTFDFFIMSKGNEQDRDKLLALGAPRPILQYIRFDAIMDPGSCSRKPQQNNAAYLPGDFCMIDEQHPDWFLLDQNGQRFVDFYSNENWVMMDPGNPGWRAFFLDRIRKTQDPDRNWNGVFLDNVEVTLSFREMADRLPASYQNDTTYQIAVQGFLEYLHTNYFKPTKHLLFANLVARRDDADWTKYVNYLDGAMHEGWSIDWPNGYRSAENWEKQISLAEQTQAMGKYIVLVSQGTKPNTTLQKFAFASYLLINQGLAAFRYANSSNYREAWVYNNYSIDLGKALGPRYRVGSAWRRDFSNGYVQVDPETHETQIQVNGQEVP